MTKTENGYAIYKMKNVTTGEIITEFFLPVKDLRGSFDKRQRLARLNTDGYVCCGFVNVDKATYLTARLNETVNEFCQNDQYRQEFRQSYADRYLDETFYETMRLIDDFKWTCLRKLDQQVRRLICEDMDVQNEIAVQLYDALHGRNSISI